jgi:hypothetical protein
MQTFEQYIAGFLEAGSTRQELGAILEERRQLWDVHLGADPQSAFEEFTNLYNWLGRPDTKQDHDISQNLARNLPGAMMQDFLGHLVLQQLEPYPSLEMFTEVRVPFGRYPIWAAGQVAYESPSQLVDIAVGYQYEDDELVPCQEPWPRPVVFQLSRSRIVLPLVVINSKIRVSQSEFFDFLGREELLTKGNPSCLSVQVALRSEMDLNIVKAAQGLEKFFLLGRGGERNVVPDPNEVEKLVDKLDEHLSEYMT